MITLAEVERIRTSGLSSSARLILYELTIRANREGICWPSIARLASDTGLSENSIRKITRQLEKAKWIRIHREDRKSHRYEIRPIEEGSGQEIEELPSPAVIEPPSPAVIEPPPPAVIEPPPPAVTAVGGSKPAKGSKKERSLLLLHEDHEDREYPEIQKVWKARNPRWALEDQQIAKILEKGITEEEVMVAINSYLHGNDLHPMLLAFRVEYLKMVGKM